MSRYYLTAVEVILILVGLVAGTPLVKHLFNRSRLVGSVFLVGTLILGATSLKGASLEVTEFLAQSPMASILILLGLILFFYKYDPIDTSVRSGGRYTAEVGWERTITKLNEVIRLGSEDARVFVARGNAYAATKQNYQRAIADFSEAIRLDPADSSAFVGRGNAYAARAAYEDYEAYEDYDLAIADFSHAIWLDPTDVRVFVARGNAYAAKPDYHRAIADFSEAIRLDPSNAMLLSTLTTWKERVAAHPA